MLGEKDLKLNILNFIELLFNVREKGLREVVDLISDALIAKIEQLEEERSGLNARIDKVEEEKAEELSRKMLEKIPECPVNIKLYFEKCPPLICLIVRFVLKCSRRIN